MTASRTELSLRFSAASPSIAVGDAVVLASRGGLTGLRRQYAAVVAVADGGFPPALRPGLLRPALAPPGAEAQSADLNPAQRRALALVLAPEPWAAIHGPPGTGKTTLLVAALAALAARGRVLAAAPSNRAVLELLARFTRAHPSVLR